MKKFNRFSLKQRKRLALGLLLLFLVQQLTLTPSSKALAEDQPENEIAATSSSTLLLPISTSTDLAAAELTTPLPIQDQATPTPTATENIQISDTATVTPITPSLPPLAANLKNSSTTIDIQTKPGTEVEISTTSQYTLDHPENIEQANIPIPTSLNTSIDSAATNTASNDNAILPIATSADATIIDTGDVGVANALVNLVDNNVIGDGIQFLVNVFKKLSDDIDLSGLNKKAAPQDLNALDINANSTSTIGNKLVVKADTGENIIASTTGENKIETGDINIANDIINLANLNIVGNGWLFAVVNVFGELDGDIILPGFDWGDASSTPPLPAEKKPEKELLITNDNYGDLDNLINVDANTGDNYISSSTYNMIKTGNVNIQNNVINLVNYNIESNSWRYTRVNIYGDWQGIVNGLPPGYNYFRDENGITIYKDFSMDPALQQAYAKMTVNAFNNASITNEIEIDANTGKNQILDAVASSAIATGDIFIKNNLLNFINSNFIGDNWEFALINIFGKWNGNLSFGKPDLWVTQSSSKSEKANKGEMITYTIAYGNSGDSPATDVSLKSKFDPRLFQGIDAQTESEFIWPIGNLPANTQGSLSYTVQVRNDAPYGDQEGVSEISISGKESDRDAANNTQRNKMLVYGGSQPSSYFLSSSGGGGGAGEITPIANLQVTTSNDAKDAVKPGDTVNFKIVVFNTGRADLENVAVTNNLTNNFCNDSLSKNLWEVGKLLAREEVTIEFAVQISDKVKDGTYLNQVVVEGFDKNRNSNIPAFASSKILVKSPAVVVAESKPKPAVKPVPKPPLSLSKSFKTSTANPGQRVAGKLVVTNNTNKNMEQIVITEKLPKGFTFTDRKTSKIWKVAKLAPGKSKTFDFTIVSNSKLKPQTYQITTALKAKNVKQTTINSKLQLKAKVASTKKKVTAKSKKISLDYRKNATFAGYETREIAQITPIQDIPTDGQATSTQPETGQDQPDATIQQDPNQTATGSEQLPGTTEQDDTQPPAQNLTPTSTAESAAAEAKAWTERLKENIDTGYSWIKWLLLFLAIALIARLLLLPYAFRDGRDTRGKTRDRERYSDYREDENTRNRPRRR